MHIYCVCCVSNPHALHIYDWHVWPWNESSVPSQPGRPLWGLELENRKPHSTGGKWSDHSPSGQKTTCFHIRIYVTMTIKTVHFKLAWYHTVVLWESFPRVTSAPTFGSLPLFLSFQHKSRSYLMRIHSWHELVLSLRPCVKTNR